ncbi:MAG: histidine phosphatase family protein [bacterium]|nr:histidine phosphatase family protein [bacterium]
MLILVKHAMPVVLAQVDAHRWELSAAGRRRCPALARELSTYQPDVIIASLEPKALATGQIVAGRLSLPLRTAEGLHEHDRAGVGLLPAGDFEDSVRRFFEHPEKLVFGNETADQAWKRFNGALLRALGNYDERSCVVVVTHGTVISLFVARANGIEPFPLWRRLGLPSFVVLSRPGFRLLDVIARVKG